jgi:archaellum component FlaC
MGVSVEGTDHKINIDAMEEYYEKVRNHLLYVRKMIKGEDEHG